MRANATSGAEDDTQNDGELSPPAQATLQAKPPAGKQSRVQQQQPPPTANATLQSIDHIEDSRQRNLLRNIQQIQEI